MVPSPAGTLHSGGYPDTLAFLRSLAGLNTADLKTTSKNSLDAADREAAADLLDWQVCMAGRCLAQTCAQQAQQMQGMLHSMCLTTAWRQHYSGQPWRQDDIVVARAPGRLDVMGGIADYSGSLVLQLPLAEACHVAAQLRSGSAGICCPEHDGSCLVQSSAFEPVTPPWQCAWPV
jgi:Galactokinase galactose-binding signature